MTSLLLAGSPPAVGRRRVRAVDTDFARGDFRALGWQVKGDWDITRYPKDLANSPGAVARFAANKPDGTLTKSFPEVRGAARLTLSLDYGWGWGDAGQGADMVAVMLLDAKGKATQIEVHRTKGKWAVQWAKVADGKSEKTRPGRPEEIDATANPFETAAASATWTSNGTRPAAGRSGAGTGTKGPAGRYGLRPDRDVVQPGGLVGTKNFDEQLFNRVVLTSSRPPRGGHPSGRLPRQHRRRGLVPGPRAAAREDGRNAQIRRVPLGPRGHRRAERERPDDVQTYLDLHRQAGVRFSRGLVSGGTDLKRLLATAKPLAEAGALLALEGNNEPNNWGVNYQGEKAAAGPSRGWPWRTPAGPV